MSKKKYCFTVLVEKCKNGYFAYCPILDGCFTQGDTYEETMNNIHEVAELCVEDELSKNNSVLTSETVSYSTISISTHL